MSTPLDILATWYAELSGGLHTHTAEVVTAAAQSDVDATTLARDEMLDWAEQVLLAHLSAAPAALHARAPESAQLLVEDISIRAERLVSLVGALKEAPTLVHAGVQAFALQTLGDSYLTAESGLLLRSLRDAGVSLDQAVLELQAGLSSYVPVPASSGCGGGGGCDSCQCSA